MRKTLTGLYAITDAGQNDTRQLLRDVEQALLGGVRVLQYRYKYRHEYRHKHRHTAPPGKADPQQALDTAHALRALTRRHDARLIINDDPQLAHAVQADGVHLGQDDVGIDTARGLLGTAAIIGVSCYNRFDLAQQASAEGADYIAFGRFFDSRTKPHAAQADTALLQRARQELTLPVVAIGGITTDNAPALIAAGADLLAVVDGLFGQPDIQAAARRFQALFNATPQR